MTENKSKNEKHSHKQEFNLQSGFINNHGNILYYKDITKNGNKLSTYEVCRLLNQLYEENEQLKQFKENVINWVDSQMKFNAKKYIETEDDHFKSENIDLHNFKVFIGIDSDD